MALWLSSQCWAFPQYQLDHCVTEAQKIHPTASHEQRWDSLCTWMSSSLSGDPPPAPTLGKRFYDKNKPPLVMGRWTLFISRTQLLRHLSMSIVHVLEVSSEQQVLIEAVKWRQRKPPHRVLNMLPESWLPGWTCKCVCTHVHVYTTAYICAIQNIAQEWCRFKN